MGQLHNHNFHLSIHGFDSLLMSVCVTTTCRRINNWLETAGDRLLGTFFSSANIALDRGGCVWNIYIHSLSFNKHTPQKHIDGYLDLRGPRLSKMNC